MSKSPKMTHEQNDNKEYCSEAFLGILDRVSKKLHLLPENIQAIERQLIENIKQNHSIKTTHNDVYENLPEGRLEVLYNIQKRNIAKIANAAEITEETELCLFDALKQISTINTRLDTMKKCG